MTEEKGSKLKDIKDTASDAVEILRELGTPGVQESLDKAKEIAMIAKEIVETMNTPEWQQNLENIRLISDNLNRASTRFGDTMKGLEDTGIIEDARQLIKTAKAKMDFLGEDGIGNRDLRELGTSFKEMIQSVKDLIDELKVTVVESKRLGTFHNIGETVKQASDTYIAITKSTRKPEP